MRKVSQIAVCSVLYVLFAAAFKAYALDMEYITYNGFDPIVAAFQKVALIFSDNSYKALFFSVIVAGMLGGVISVLAKAAGGAKTSAIAWAFPVGIGVVLYLGLFIPQGTLTIYDEAKNRSQTVTLPDGIVAVAGLFNTIEHGLVEIVQTASDPLSYMQNAGGIGFDMLANLGSKGVMLSDKNIMANLRSYTEDCMLFEMQRPGTTLTTNNLGNNTDFMALYELAANPSNYTTVYNDTHPEGTTATCTVAWEGLKADLNNNTKYDNVTKSKCADAGFDPANATELNQCKTLFGSTTNWLYGATYTYVQLFRQTLMATAINDALMSASPDAAAMVLASRNTGASMVSSGIVANQWIPVIKGVLTAVAIGIIPILVIFIPTPLFSKALSIICGFFIWLAVWGVTDAIIHTFGMDYAKKVYDEVAQHQLGTVAIMNFGSSSLKALAAFGAIRWAGLMLATVITGMLVRFGGHAVAQLAGQLTSSVQHGGGSAGMAAVTPEGRAQELQKLEGAPAVMTNAHRFSFGERSAIKTAEMTGRTSGMASLLREQGQAGLAQMIAQSTKGSMIRNAALGNAAQYMGTDAFISNATKGQITANATAGAPGSKQAAESLGITKGKKQLGDAVAFKKIANEHGMDEKQFAEHMGTMSYGKVAQIIDKYANHKGISFQQAATELGELMGHKEFVGNTSYGNARGVVGENGMIQSETGKILNEAAKMRQIYEFAKTLGYAGTEDDFEGIYRYNQTHHATDTIMIDNEKMRDIVNAKMKEMGYSTQFKVGDKVAIGRLQDGRITLARGMAGAESDNKDIYKTEYGRKSDHYDLTTSTTGTRGSHGNRNERYDINSFEGKREIMGPNNEKMTVYGKWQEDGKGNVIAGEYTNSLNNRVVYEHAVLTGYEGGDQNKPIYHKQFAVADRVMTAKGQLVTAHTRNLSKEELSKNGFAVNTTIGPNGERLYSSAVRGNQATDVNKILIDQQSEAKFSFASGLFKQGQDFTNISDTQALALFTAEGMKKIADTAPTAISVKRGLGDLISKTKGINSDGGSGGSISNADIKDMQKYNQRVESTKKPAYELYKNKSINNNVGNSNTHTQGSGSGTNNSMGGNYPNVERVTSQELKQRRQQKLNNASGTKGVPNQGTVTNTGKQTGNHIRQVGMPPNAANSVVKNEQHLLPGNSNNRSLNNMLLQAAIPLASNSVINNGEWFLPAPSEAKNNVSPSTVKQQYPTANVQGAAQSSGVNHTTGQGSNAVPNPNVNQARQTGGTQQAGARQTANVQGAAQSSGVNHTTGQGSNAVPNPNVNQARQTGGTQQEGTTENNVVSKKQKSSNKENNTEKTAQNDGIKSMYAATIATTTGGINYATDAQVAGGKQYEKQKPIDILKEFINNNKIEGQQNAEQFYEHLSNKYGNDKANEMIQSYAGHNYNQELMHELQSYAQQTNIMQSEAKQAHDGYASAEIESNSSNMDNKKEQQTAEHNIPKTDMNRADSANNIRQDDLEHAQETNNANPSTETHSEVKQQGSVSTKSMNDQANNNTIDQMISNYTYGANDIAAPDVAQFLDEQTQAIPNPDMNRLDSETPSQDTRLSQNSMPNSYEEPPVYATENKTDTITESTSNTNTPYDLFQPKASSSKAADNHITQLTREMLEREKTNTSMANIEPIPGGSVGVEYKQTGDVNREVIPGGNTEPIPGGNSDGIQGVPGGKKI